MSLLRPFAVLLLFAFFAVGCDSLDSGYNVCEEAPSECATALEAPEVAAAPLPETDDA